MANELRWAGDVPGLNVAMWFRGSTGLYWRTDTKVYEAMTLANRALYGATITDPNRESVYVGSIPDGLNMASVDLCPIVLLPSYFTYALPTSAEVLAAAANLPVVRNPYALFNQPNDFATPTAQTFTYPQGSIGRVAAFLPAATGNVRFLEENGPTLTILNPDGVTFATGYATPIPAYFQGAPGDTIQVWRNVDTTALAVTSGTPYTCQFLCAYMGNDGQVQTQTLLAYLYVTAP